MKYTELVNEIKALILSWFGVWKTYTPTWSGTGGTPSIGNGTLTGRYTTVGDVVILKIYMLWGSTTTANSATAWKFSIPITSANTIANFGLTYIRDAATANYIRDANIGVNSSLIDWQHKDASNTNSLAYNEPITWTEGDNMTIEITYERA